ncbi:hypothetical protein EYY60_10720 [Flavobacterium zhairuonense]|uniref:hypothetical protein n=1 Tax=Flavobacterium zhairuonense TaxID=2493631 RepID=UPI00104A77F2|nr:hypothetical protein [Flavobacterium zhairuonense]KAF2509985.1 hypothetical protein EYY60_10720 [Flavobacterium zhairuonense]
MKKWIFFLRKIKLIESFSVEIPLSLNDLVKKIDILLYEDRSGFFSGTYSSKTQFIGKVNKKGFEIRNNLMQMTKGKTVVIAYGSFTDLNEKTEVNIEIKGFDKFMHLFYGMQLLFYSILILYLIFHTDRIINQLHSLPLHSSFWGIVTNVIILGCLFFGMTIYPYFKMRKSMEEIEDDLRRELCQISKE